ncbi:hypothetical protein SCLCIDRAFT_491661, partial [Scleroderma citrinum Foug A]
YCAGDLAGRCPAYHPTLQDVQRCESELRSHQHTFTDHCIWQTLDCCIEEIGPPPTGQPTPFKVYVALSRSRGRNNIHLLRIFEERLFTHHPSEYLKIWIERQFRGGRKRDFLVTRIDAQHN